MVGGVAVFNVASKSTCSGSGFSSAGQMLAGCGDAANEEEHRTIF